jgi:hypothetical protein
MKFKLNYIKPSQHFPKQQLVFEIFWRVKVWTNHLKY